MQLEDNAVAFVRFNLRFPLTNLTSKLYKERTLLPTKLLKLLLYTKLKKRTI